MNTATSVHPAPPPVKGRKLRPVGEVIGLFPSYDPAEFLTTFDLCRLGEARIQKTVLAHDATLPWPPTAPIAFAAWLRDNEIHIITATFLCTLRSRKHWLGQYRLILGQEEIH